MRVLEGIAGRRPTALEEAHEACHVWPANDPSVAYRSKYQPPPWVADHATAFREDPSSSS